MKAVIDSDKAPTPVGPYSPGLSVGEWIFLSGQGGFDPQTGKIVGDVLVEQTEQRTTVRADLAAGLRAEITVIAKTA